MEIKGTDVSTYQGNVDWETVADYGIGFAILRITEKGNKTDSTFEQNYKGCTQHGIPVKTGGATYTGNMLSVFKKCGFKDVTAQVNRTTGVGLDISLLDEVVDLLRQGKQLEERYRDHGLTGNFAGFRECHIKWWCHVWLSPLRRS